MESVENNGAFGYETHEKGVLANLLEKAGARQLALAAALMGGTSGCVTVHSTGVSSLETTRPISLAGQQYCDAVDSLEGRGDGSSLIKQYKGANGEVVVQGIVEGGKLIATVSVTTPDGRTQRIDCR